MIGHILRFREIAIGEERVDEAFCFVLDHNPH